LWDAGLSSLTGENSMGGLDPAAQQATPAAVFTGKQASENLANVLGFLIEKSIRALW
jgi:hypothetical protein